MLSNPSEPSQKANKEETAIAFGGPALLTNRFYVTLTSGGVRIAFAETPKDGVPVFRTAVSLSFQDGISLHRVLGDAVKQAETALARAAMERVAPDSPTAAKAN